MYIASSGPDKYNESVNFSEKQASICLESSGTAYNHK